MGYTGLSQKASKYTNIRWEINNLQYYDSLSVINHLKTVDIIKW